MLARKPDQIRPQLGAGKSSAFAFYLVLAIVLIDVIGVALALILPRINHYFQ